MPVTGPERGALFAVGALLMVFGARAASAQTEVRPINDLPNPYRTIQGWAKLPEGRTWGSTSAVEIDPDGKSVWVAERCGANSCAGSTLDPVLKFDSTGKLVKSFGAGLMLSPHGIAIDRDGNIWITDCACTGRAGPGAPPPPPTTTAKGHQVFKFSPEGTLLMTLGKAGGDTLSEFFFQPNDVLITPGGQIFVAEGHGQGRDRILKFKADGQLDKVWGKRGTGPSEFDQPHALAMDKRGRLFVGDRTNDRIQIFNQEGALMEEWRQFSRPSGIFIDRATDLIYVADSESGSVEKKRTDWKRGIRIGGAGRTGPPRTTARTRRRGWPPASGPARRTCRNPRRGRPRELRPERRL